MESSWSTPDGSWLHMEGAGEEERSVFNVVRMNEAEPFKCLTDKRDFQAERERKEFLKEEGRLKQENTW